MFLDANCSDAELIADAQIKLLLNTSLTRQLNLEEVRILQILVETKNKERASRKEAEANTEKNKKDKLLTSNINPDQLAKALEYKKTSKAPNENNNQKEKSSRSKKSD